MIGKLEELVLLAVIKTGSNAVPSAIFETFSSSSDQGDLASFGAVYTTLDRLSKKGLVDVKNQLDDNGRKRKFYEINSNGRLEVKMSINRSINLGGLILAGA